MTDPGEFSVWPDADLKPVRDASQPTPSKKRCTVCLQPVIQEEGEPRLEDWTKSKGKGTSVWQDAHEETGSGHPSPDTLLKCVPTECAGMEEEGSIAPNPLDCQFDDSTSDSKLGLLLSPGGVSADGGLSMRALSAGDSVIAAMPTLPVVPHRLAMSAQEINADIKRQVMKGIRQFGRKYEGIFKLFEQVQGPLEIRKQFVEFAIKEAARFKRRHLIKQLEEILEKIVSDIHLTEDEAIQLPSI